MIVYQGFPSVCSNRTYPSPKIHLFSVTWEPHDLSTCFKGSFLVRQNPRFLHNFLSLVVNDFIPRRAPHSQRKHKKVSFTAGFLGEQALYYVFGRCFWIKKLQNLQCAKETRNKQIQFLVWGWGRRGGTKCGADFEHSYFFFLNI